MILKKLDDWHNDGFKLIELSAIERFLSVQIWKFREVSAKTSTKFGSTVPRLEGKSEALCQYLCNRRAFLLLGNPQSREDDPESAIEKWFVEKLVNPFSG